MKTNCKQCNIEFDTRPANLKRGKGKFCSVSCAMLMRKSYVHLEKYKFKKGEYSENKHWFWKGDKAGYQAIHNWIHKILGKANKCTNTMCVYPKKNWDGELMKTPKRYEWSNISGTYKRDTSDWTTLCVSCHRKYDRMRRRHGLETTLKVIRQ